MTGKVKIIVSSNTNQLKADKTWDDANIHFRDYRAHTLILNDENIYYIIIENTTIEANSLLIEADSWKIEKSKPVDTEKEVLNIEFRFIPKIEK